MTFLRGRRPKERDQYQEELDKQLGKFRASPNHLTSFHCRRSRQTANLSRLSCRVRLGARLEDRAMGQSGTGCE